MNINILAIGDITGQTGIDAVKNKLRGIQKFYNIAFTVINGENAAGLGITPDNAQALLDAGANVITLGNHTWSRRQIQPFLDDCRYILRPSNYAPQIPGRGWGLFSASFGDVCVINLIGRCEMTYGNENPFFEADKILKQVNTKFILVDFHAAATSEKHAMAYYLDGRVSVVWGTHTHVQTSDCRIFPGGTGYITDLGMTGACDSIIGMVPKQSVSHFLGNPPERYESAAGPAKIEGAVFEIDADTGRCISAEALRIL